MNIPIKNQSPTATFLEEIEKKQVSGKDIKDKDFYISKKDVIKAYKKREDSIKEIVTKFFRPGSHPMKLLGFTEEEK